MSKKETKEEIVYYDPTSPKNQEKTVRFWLRANEVTLEWYKKVSKHPWKVPDLVNPAKKLPRIQADIRTLKTKLDNIS